MLDMFFIREDLGSIQVCDERETPLSARNDGSLYRFYLVVTTETGKSSSEIIEVKQSGKWDSPHVEIINTRE